MGADGFTACTSADILGAFGVGFARVVRVAERVDCANFVMMKVPSGYAPIGAGRLNVIGGLH